MSFLSKLPGTYQQLQKDREATKAKAFDCWARLDESDEAADTSTHSCNCKYCGVDKDAKPLPAAEYDELAVEGQRLDDLVADYDKTIASVEGYAKLMKVNLYKAKIRS